MESSTILTELLKDPRSSAPAIIDTSYEAVVTYKSLAEQVESLASQLLGAGLKAGDVVAIVLPNGLEFLVVFLALTRARLVASPVNPVDTTAEMQFFIGAGHVKAVIAKSDNAAAAEIAQALALPIWVPQVESSGIVKIPQLASTARGSADAPNREDVALLMYTSGTTGRPKGVPLTHENVARSASNIAAHYALRPEDRSVVVMPLFHGHGLIGAALSTLASGGVLIVPPRFSASGFWPLFREHQATWYTAVPTIHQILLTRADSDGAPDHGARFIRSCSAALAPAVLANLEKRFGAPVLEAYGMTEASHQVASNPLPPRPRKRGTVGLGTSVEIGILDKNGTLLAPHAAGEVVLRGPTLMKGYRHNPEATAAAFFGEWFRTGDVGVLDNDGYLTMTGRIKDMINRGGEKIFPEEIEAVLLEHPAVAEAAAFPIPDPKYGEEVSAAVVLRGTADSTALKTFCRARLADFKVPKTIWITSVLPKKATGKIDRRKLQALFNAQN
ncbi:MAG: AMP-binding protein [Deltaproteobacteria bacterium]|nr:AMP-binding protein [Deltaproteobacteria bacterium]